MLVSETTIRLPDRQTLRIVHYVECRRCKWQTSKQPNKALAAKAWNEAWGASGNQRTGSAEQPDARYQGRGAECATMTPRLRTREGCNTETVEGDAK
jgi:hypothetical protein